MDRFALHKDELPSRIGLARRSFANFPMLDSGDRVGVIEVRFHGNQTIGVRVVQLEMQEASDQRTLVRMEQLREHLARDGRSAARNQLVLFQTVGWLENGGGALGKQRRRLVPLSFERELEAFRPELALPEPRQESTGRNTPDAQGGKNTRIDVATDLLKKGRKDEEQSEPDEQ